MADYPDLDTRLIEQLPPWYRVISDYQEICRAEQPQLDTLAVLVRSAAGNFFFQTMNEGAVRQWEQILRIIPDSKVEDLDFRRARVINRISIRPPFTLGFLYQRLDELIGPGEWDVTVDYPNYTLYIVGNAKKENYASELRYTIGKIKPAHLAYQVTYVFPAMRQTARMGGVMSSITSTPIPEQPDDLVFRETASMGGSLGSISCTPVPERPDGLTFRDTANIGGGMGSVSVTPLPEG